LLLMDDGSLDDEAVMGDSRNSASPSLRFLGLGVWKSLEIAERTVRAREIDSLWTGRDPTMFHRGLKPFAIDRRIRGDSHRKVMTVPASLEFGLRRRESD